MKATTKIVLDTRYKKLNSDTFPVRLRVTHNKVQKYFPTSYSLTEKQWKKMHSARPDNLKETLLTLSEIETKAKNIIAKLPAFSFETFKLKFERKEATAHLLSTAFTEYIASLYENDQVGTAISYTNAKNSFAELKPDITLSDVTEDFLKQYENWMSKKGRTVTTIGMYLRCVRRLLNRAIINGDLSPTAYPFARGRYQIKTARKQKKAYTAAQVLEIYNYPAEQGSTLEMARDIWFAMYLFNGCNPKDLCLFKYKHIDGDRLTFVREKTKRTNSEEKVITVILGEDHWEIINKHGNLRKPENYIFPVLRPGLYAIEEKRLINQFTCLLNDHLKTILPGLSCGKARHTFATTLKRSGIPIEQISEMMSHSDIKVTKHYLGDFEERTLQIASSKLIDFKSNLKVAQ